MPAQNPLITYTLTLVRSTRRPISRDDGSLPPTAYTVRPNRL